MNDFTAEIKHPDEIPMVIAAKSPKIILGSIEDINNPSIQKTLMKLNIVYVSVDEAQVITNFIIMARCHNFPKSNKPISS